MQEGFNMNKFLIIFVLMLLPLTAKAEDFKKCVKTDTGFECYYVNPFVHNDNVVTMCNRLAVNAKNGDAFSIKEITLLRYKKYCNPTYDFPVEAKSMDEAVAKAKERINGIQQPTKP